MITVNDFYNFCKEKNTAFLYYTGFDFMSDYADNYSKFDALLCFMFESRIYSMKENAVTQSVLDDFKNKVNAFLIMKNYTYKKLYETMNLEYNPIWNVDGTETTTIEGTDTKTTTNTSVNEGSNILKNTGHTDTDSTEVNGNVTNTDMHEVSADTEVTYYPQDKDTHTQSEVTNTKNDVVTLNTMSSNTTDSTTTNDGTETGTNEQTISIVKHGNIGVTSTQNLIEQERETALFNFYMIVFTDIINMFFLSVYM